MREFRRALCWGFLILSALAAVPRSQAAGQWDMDSAGIRAGFSATRIDLHFRQLGAYGRLNTPLKFSLSSEYQLHTSIDFLAGVLGREEYLAFMANTGPVFALRKSGFPIELVAGSSPTILSRTDFGKVNFGIPVQFTSHLGFDFRLARHWVANYRFQHMSNAGLAAHNPGLNLHSFSIGYRF
jgi:hypothetical protein